MKKKKIDFEARFWASYSETCPLRVIELFKSDTLSETKDRLYELMHFAMKPEVFLPNNPSLVFHFYTSLKSFLRAAYVLNLKPKKVKLNEPPDYVSHVMQGSLYDDEYTDPFFVFERAFENYSLQQFEDFLTEVTYYALAPYIDHPKGNIISLFLHLQKMLDAARIIKERKTET
ncbi:MAG: hypothetical protein I8H68_09430 [Flavobacteriia bacterium]|nr:hypothetical protein [Flavobacteriia bacterium]MBH2022793.1 hypothetical protein [Flavobacteriales bacterium]